ncbi:LD-carboxypeptidase [Neosynechococcus sphagnicola]|uniref:LD-carboxypeptidase n=1 Tax=Neosynechococcus sphagnicola TaxID=1501145 RepID=UPI000B2C0C77
MQRCQLPDPLQPGDRLCVIAPSGALRSSEHQALQEGIAHWQARGYEVIGHWDSQWGYLAGSDSQRRQQLQEVWQDPHCRGLLCARGGFGSTRLLESWQWPPSDPRDRKWLIGFSDITSLLWSLSQQQIAGVHGPVLTTLAAEPDWSRQRLFAWVEQHQLPELRGVGWGGGRDGGCCCQEI